MWVGMKGILDKQAGEADATMITLRAQDGRTASSSRRKREVLVEHSPASWQKPQPTKCSTQNSTRSSTRGCRRTLLRQKGKTVVQTDYRESAKEENQRRVAKHGNGKAAGTDNIVNELMKHGGGTMLITTLMLYRWIRENEYALERWRE